MDDTPHSGHRLRRRSPAYRECEARYVSGVPAPLVTNALVPFATRLADDGMVHVRAWDAQPRPVVLVAELDWAVLVADRRDAYFGPGIYTYPGYALATALEACGEIGPNPVVVVRLPDPPGERLLQVVDPDDPQGWEPITLAAVREMLDGSDPAGPPPGAYVPRVVEAWVRSGELPG